MKVRLFVLLLPLAITALSNVGNAANFEGTTIKIAGSFNTTGRVPLSPYALNTNVHLGPNNQLEIDSAGRKYHTLLDGSPTPNAFEHPMRCGGVVVGVNNQPEYAKAKINDGILTFSTLIDWTAQLRSAKCAGGGVRAHRFLNQEFVVDLKNGCKFQYNMKQAEDDKVIADLQIEGECTLTQ